MKLKSTVFFTLFCFGTLLAQQLNHVQGDILIQLKPSQSPREIVAKMANLYNGQADVQLVEELSAPLRIWLVRFDFTKIQEKRFLADIQNMPGVQLAQFNHLVSLRETIPNDPSFPNQWQWVNTGQGGGTPDADVDADLAWDITTGGTTANGHEIVVCVMEGANRNNPDLQGNLWFNTAEIPGNGMDDDLNGYVDDYNGWNSTNDSDNIPSASHGTQVSGMIGAKGNNGQIVTGINWDVKIMHVLVGSLNEANVVKAYTYPLVQRKRFNESGGAQGAFVVVTNASWGIDNGDPADSPLWCSFYDSLGVEGILSCGATANNNVNIDVVLDLPTACPSEYLVAVTATNNKDVRTFSGYGTTHVDLGAPGESIVTLSTNGGPSTTSGTSFASPLTAGIIALLYSAPCSSIGEQALADPAGTALLVRNALFDGVDIIPNLVPETKYGGRVNAFNSLNLLLQTCGPCPKAYGITISDIIDTSAVIAWQSTDSTLQTDLRYRIVGSPDWTLVQGISSPIYLTGLQACNNYEFQLEEICSSDSSGFSNSYFFATEGCCLPPANFTVQNITNNSASLSWEPVYAAVSYTLKLTSGTDYLLISDLTGNSFDLENLSPCGDYTVEMQTVCDTGATAFTTPIAFTTLGCGACLDLNYCDASGTDTQYEWIENVTIGSINNSSGDNGGYAIFPNVTTDLLTFTSNPISLTPGFSAAGTYPEWFVVYLDLNHDGDFNDGGEKVFDAGATTSTTVTGNIIVPGTALLGSTRMRVIMRWNSQPNSACSNFDAGEVEDYCVTIVAGTTPDCAVPLNLTVLDTTLTTANIGWGAIAAATDYTLRYRKVGITGWTSKVAASNSLELTPLETCKEYEVQVRSNCTGVNGDFSPSMFLKTRCISGTEEALSQQLVVELSPNPFEQGFVVNYTLAEPEQIQIQILDVWGRKLAEETKRSPAGPNQASFDLELASGVYFVKIKVNAGEIIQRVVKK
jgi:hypothetical protein